MDTVGQGRTHVELAPIGDDELLAIGVVVADEVLATAHVAEEEQHVLVADGPEVGTGTVVPDQGEPVALGERVQVLPVFEVLRPEQVVRRNGGISGAFGNASP